MYCCADFGLLDRKTTQTQTLFLLSTAKKHRYDLAENLGRLPEDGQPQTKLVRCIKILLTVTLTPDSVVVPLRLGRIKAAANSSTSRGG